MLRAGPKRAPAPLAKGGRALEVHCWNNTSCPAEVRFRHCIWRNSGTMNALALLIAVVSFVLSAIPYWRAGGKQDVENAKRELEREREALPASQKDLTANDLQTIAQPYQRGKK